MRDDRLTVALGSLVLDNPVMPASGCFGPELAPVISIESLGAVVTKTVFSKVRAGNPAPRIAEVSGGLLNSVGIPSPGINGFQDKILPKYQSLGRPVIVSIGGLSAEDYWEVAESLADANIAALEINVSCPNLEREGLEIGSDPRLVEMITRGVRQRVSKKVIITKVTPNTDSVVELARAAEAGGADAVTVSNTFIGLAIDAVSRKAVLGNFTGGFSGPSVKPLVLRLVEQVARAILIPVVGCGGIRTARDVAEYLIAGAAAIQVGTATFSRPSTMTDIISELPGLLDTLHVGKISQLTGTLARSDAGQRALPESPEGKHDGAAATMSLSPVPPGVTGTRQSADRPADESDPVLHLLPPAPQVLGSPAWLDAPVVRNDHDRDSYWQLVLYAPEVAAAARPGQFIMLTPPQADGEGPALPRPMAIFDANRTGEIIIRYAVVGRGTGLLAAARTGQTLVTVGPLGRPFAPDATGRGPVLLLGRGVGICSLTLLGAHAVQAGRRVTAISSGRTRQAVIGTEHYLRSGVRVREVYDDDGSSDVDALARRLRAMYPVTPPSLIATCGSRRLMVLAARLGRAWDSDVQASVEAPMACGLGYCHGCATADHASSAESPLICSDGPVFRYSLHSPVQRRNQPTFRLGCMKLSDLACRVQNVCMLHGNFTLHWGGTSTYYFDKYQFESDPGLLRSITEAMVGLIPAGTEVLAGLEMGAIAITASLASHTGLPCAFVRNEAKSYGTRRLAEGASIASRRVLIVEDVVTSGRRMVITVNQLRELGANVSHVLCVIDRNDGAARRLAENGITMQHLFQYQDGSLVPGLPHLAES